MVATALLVSATSASRFNRRRSQLERLPAIGDSATKVFLIIGVAGYAGLVGARLYIRCQETAKNLAGFQGRDKAGSTSPAIPARQ